MECRKQATKAHVPFVIFTGGMAQFKNAPHMIKALTNAWSLS
jgi:hypothetical protein